MTSSSDLPPAPIWPKSQVQPPPADHEDPPYIRPVPASSVPAARGFPFAPPIPVAESAPVSTQIPTPASESVEPDVSATSTSPEQAAEESATHAPPEETSGSDSSTGPADPSVQTPAEVDQPTLPTLIEAVGTLRAALEASQDAQEHQRALLDKLHDERQALREAEQRRFRDPVVRELIQLSDTCLRNSRQWKTRAGIDPDTAKKVSAVLLDAAADVGLILERQGVESFAPLIDDQFDRAFAKAVGSRETADSSRDGRVAEVQKPGYRLGDRVIRFSDVVVWKATAPADSPPVSG